MRPGTSSSVILDCQRVLTCARTFTTSHPRSATLADAQVASVGTASADLVKAGRGGGKASVRALCGYFLSQASALARPARPYTPAQLSDMYRARHESATAARVHGGAHRHHGPAVGVMMADGEVCLRAPTTTKKKHGPAGRGAGGTRLLSARAATNGQAYVHEGAATLGFQPATAVGSPDYMAPELLAGEGYDYRVDFWAIGCIAFEMLVGIVGSRNSSRMASLPWRWYSSCAAHRAHGRGAHTRPCRVPTVCCGDTRGGL